MTPFLKPTAPQNLSPSVNSLVGDSDMNVQATQVAPLNNSSSMNAPYLFALTQS